MITAIVILFLTYILAKMAGATARKAYMKKGTHESATNIIGKTAYFGILLIGIVVAFKIVNVDISIIVGAAGFGLGFALKDILENYIAGVLILVTEPFKIGDIIKVDDYLGQVEEIEARTTFIRNLDGQRVIISNSQMMQSSVVNYSTYPERRISIEVGVSYDTDLNKATKLIIETLARNNAILKDPEPAIIYHTFADSSINMTVRFWIDSTITNWLEITSVEIKEIKKVFDANNINIPFPITTLSLNQLDSDDIYRVFGKEKNKDPMPVKSIEQNEAVSN